MVLTKALQDWTALPNKHSTAEPGSSSQIFCSGLCPTSVTSSQQFMYSNPVGKMQDLS